MASKFPPLEDFEKSDDKPFSAEEFAEHEKQALGDDIVNSLPPVEHEKFPALDINSDIPPANINTNGEQRHESDLPNYSNANSYEKSEFESHIEEEEEEPEEIRQWQEKRNKEIAERDERSEKAKEDTIKEATQALEKFYDSYTKKREASIKQAQEHAKELLNKRESDASGSTWSRIVKLVDLSEKSCSYGGRDKSKMRDMLIALSKDETAPGASY